MIIFKKNLKKNLLLLALTFTFLSQALGADPIKKGAATLKKNKLSLGNININATTADDLIQLADKFVVTADGNVGINTMTPTATLNVNGNANIDGPANVSGDLRIAGSLEAGGTVNLNGPLNLNGPVKMGETVFSKNMLKIAGAKSGFISFVTPPEAGSTTYTLPKVDGKTGEFLTTDGTGTLTWSTLKPYRISCPKDFSLIGTADTSEVFCISTAQEPPSSWLKAIANCYSKSVKARLCTASEWAMSCVTETSKKMTGHWEWVADSGSNYGRIIGLAGCDSFNGASVDMAYGSRCCFR